MGNQRLPDLLERIGNLLRTAERETGAREGLQPVHLAALRYLSRANRYSDTPGAVGDYLGITKGTVSQSLLLLEREGLLVRRPDRRDKRVVHLALSPQGKRLARRALPAAFFQQATQNLGSRDAVRLERLLTALLSGLQTANQSRTFGVCHSCRFFTVESQGLRCGLTQERLSKADSQRICREHERPGSGGPPASPPRSHFVQ